MSRLRPVSMTDALVASLRERILDGQFAPEAALGEIELATAYGVARPTVRSAIQQLVHEGLLRRERSRSAHVPRLTQADVRDLFLVRTPLELAVVETLVARGVHPDGAEHATRRMQALAAGASWSELVDTDLAFHRSLVEATESPRLERLHRLAPGRDPPLSGPAPPGLPRARRARRRAPRAAGRDRRRRSRARPGAHARAPRQRGGRAHARVRGRARAGGVGPRGPAQRTICTP